MTSELVINASPSGGRIALLQNKGLVEFHYENNSENFSVGDIYLGTVRRIVPGLNAAFIDIGYEKDAFLHYLDLGPNVTTLMKYTKSVRVANKKPPQLKLGSYPLDEPIDKLGKMADVLKNNQQILVQVVKEPISTKGPRLSCQLSLAGRYLVLVPFSNEVNISRKITDKNERRRLQKLLNSLKPENFGVIVRTMAEGKDVAELDRDLSSLIEKWNKGAAKLATAKPNEKMIGEMTRTSSMLRDMLNESFDSIVVDDKEMSESIKSYIHDIAPEKEKIVRFYTGKAKIFEQFGIEKQLKLLFGKTVSLPSGGYLIIEHTEALHVIDVNSGNKSSSESDQESTALKVNLEAAAEVARQLRLRDMGGIIVVDFIDMRKIEHKKQLYTHIKDEMSRDRSKFTVLPLSKFGLMQITRQRVRPEVNIVTLETCPTCNGTGKTTASIGIADLIESRLDYLLTKQNEKGLVLTVHPYLFAFFTKGLYSKRMQWFFKYGKWIKCVADTSLALSEFRITNQAGQDVEVNFHRNNDTTNEQGEQQSDLRGQDQDGHEDEE